MPAGVAELLAGHDRLATRRASPYRGTAVSAKTVTRLQRRTTPRTPIHNGFIPCSGTSGYVTAMATKPPLPPPLHLSLPAGGRSWHASLVSFPHAESAETVIGQPARVQFEAFLDEHRRAINHCLDGLTEEQARRSLGLVKHVTFVEKVWFDEAITCRSRAEIGIPATPDESFILQDDDTIASIQRAHLQAWEASRLAASSLGLDDLVHGNRRGPLPLRWVYLHMLRELAQHCGHADILREQILALVGGDRGSC
jgi:hypothetical protein